MVSNAMITWRKPQCISIRPVKSPCVIKSRLTTRIGIPLSQPCPKITLHSVSVHPSAHVFGNRVVHPVDVLPAMLECDPKSWWQMFHTTNKSCQWAWRQMVVEPSPFSPASEKTSCSKMMENFQCKTYFFGRNGGKNNPLVQPGLHARKGRA